MKTRFPLAVNMIMFFAIICGMLPLRAKAAEPADNAISNVEENYCISYQSGTWRPAVVDYDATSDYVYFAYSESISAVDAYDLNGEFAFTILFASREKGIISVRCENNLLYVSTKFGNIFVFDGDQLLETIESSSAANKGYSWKWFESKQRNISLIGVNLYLLNQDREINCTIPVPFHVIWGIYSEYVPIIAIVVALCVTAFRPTQKINKHRPFFFNTGKTRCCNDKHRCS